MTTRNNFERLGNFTSSQVHRLMGAPGKAKTYIEECNMERRLGRPVGKEVSSKEMSWGIVGEMRCFDLLGTQYRLVSQETIKHHEIDFWSGSPDGDTKDAVIEIKCPFTMKSFCELVDIIESGDAQNLRDEKESYYWQIVSNACLTGKDFGELIVYCPYQSELSEMKKLADNVPVEDLWKTRWLEWAQDEELPFILNDGNYCNVNILRFEIPETDKSLIRTKIQEYGKLLVPVSSPILKTT